MRNRRSVTCLFHEVGRALPGRAGRDKWPHMHPVEDSAAP